MDKTEIRLLLFIIQPDIEYQNYVHIYLKAIKNNFTPNDTKIPTFRNIKAFTHDLLV